MKIHIEQTETKGAVQAEIDGNQVAEMTYSIAGPSLIIIDHTDVSEAVQGQGVGRQLLLRLIEKARNEEIKILPLCPFAKSVFDKEDELRDVLR